MIRDIKCENRNLIITSGRGSKIVQLPKEIATVLNLDDIVIVMAEPNNVDGDRNISCYDEEGRKVWTIEQPDKVYGANPFTYLGQDKDGNIVAGCWNGTTYKVDPKTGKFISKEFTK